VEIRPRVSIIICTCNRAADLRDTLRAIDRVAIPADLPTEVVVVDNASTDDTVHVARAETTSQCLVRYVREGRRGKGYAYNTGMAAARGEIFLFTDDDVRPPVNWVEGMCRPIAAGEADAIAGGVRLAPYLERPWLRGFLRTLLASTDALAAAGEVEVIGANMAFSRRILQKVPAFDPELGPGALGFGDEALFAAQIREAGFTLVPRWDVAVEHHCSADRLNRDGLAGIAKRMGYSRAYVQYHWEHLDVAAPRLAELWVWLKLFSRRCYDRLTSGGREPKPWEVAYITHAHLYRRYRAEQLKPRNYDRRGLVKLRGLTDLARMAEGCSK
jgi:glycosyltransferase involved in cell wall biosynthesis